jgi:hypothetical protein
MPNPGCYCARLLPITKELDRIYAQGNQRWEDARVFSVSGMDRLAGDEMMPIRRSQLPPPPPSRLARFRNQSPSRPSIHRDLVYRSQCAAAWKSPVCKRPMPAPLR